MRPLQVLIPMAGAGSRFVQAGFTTPKPLIEVDGQPMFRKALSSLDNIKTEKNYIFVIRRQHVDEQQLDERIKEALPEAEIVIIPAITRGAAETALAAEAILKPSDGLLIMDCDLWFQSQNYNELIQFSLNDQTDITGALLTFTADNPRYSYAKFGSDQIVTETAEKRVISTHAITGAYFFSKASDFTLSAHKLLSQTIGKEMPEYYISFLYNILINEGKKIQAATVDQFASFGTPEELQSYRASH